MKELTKEEKQKTLIEANGIIVKIASGEIRNDQQVLTEIEQKIVDIDCRSWLLSYLLAERTLRVMDEVVRSSIQPMESKPTENLTNDVMFT